MGNWLDRWARRAAAPGPEAPPVAAPADDSRRTFLKRAALVTGAAWSVPVMQTALAPAASASPGTAVGEVCTNPAGDEGALCGDGSRCHNGQCGSDGAICTAAAHCTSGGCSSGYCVATGTAIPGAMCLTDAACAYSNCNGGICGRGAPLLGAPCGTPNGTTNNPGQPAACAPGSTCRRFLGINHTWRCRT